MSEYKSRRRELIEKADIERIRLPHKYRQLSNRELADIIENEIERRENIRKDEMSRFAVDSQVNNKLEENKEAPMNFHVPGFLIDKQRIALYKLMEQEDIPIPENANTVGNDALKLYVENTIKEQQTEQDLIETNKGKELEDARDNLLLEIAENLAAISMEHNHIGRAHRLQGAASRFNQARNNQSRY